MSCTGHCCEHFPLPYTLKKIKREASKGAYGNGTQLEFRMVAEMLIPLPIPPTKRKRNGNFKKDKFNKYYWFTCKHFNRQTRLCGIYDKRPVMCRTYPDNSLCKDSVKNGCDMTCGTDYKQAIKDFKKIHGISQPETDYDRLREDRK